MDSPLKFRISSALKDIIGRDLITDDFIAVFELVKNSFDAHASQVDIYFQNIFTENGKIIIKDNGKGMNYEDLLNKWLFVAYSAKQEGTEDNNYDYRENIQFNRPFAGAKGIGRFSCDRLGKYLYLETTKEEENPKTEVLITEWEKFEENIKDEFIDITVLYETKLHSSFGLVHGTVLEISSLRSIWDRSKLLKLKDSLAKLINPTKDLTKKSFKIYIHVPEEDNNDKLENEHYKIVNGEVQNFIFETLGLKTTKIHAQISKRNINLNNYLTTQLIDGGTLIYEIKEENRFNLLSEIEFTLFYLNRSAKITFAKRMGLASKVYGHVFLYKNSFRVYPYGESNEDPLKIELRKSRRLYSRLGTGEVMGQIEIFGDNLEFKETSSRGDGLIKNPTYYQLEECFYQILERLETYVIGVQRWGLSIEDENNADLNSRITELIAQLTKSDQILDFKAPDNLLDILEDSQAKSAEAVIKNLRKIAIESKDDYLLKTAGEAAIKLFEVQEARKEAERVAEEERRKARKAKKDLEEKISENLFLKSVKSQDLDEIISFMHSIGISATTIDNYLSSLYKKINKGIEISKNELKRAFEAVSFENRKILSITRFSTKANFQLYAEDAYLDIIEYIKEYIINILVPLRTEDIEIIVNDNYKLPLMRTFKPIEFSILIDNLISNSIRAKAKRFNVVINESDYGELQIEFSDDGIGISDDILEKVFDFGFTTTSGSGLGLFHIHEIVKKMKAEIKIDNKQSKGVKFILIIK